MKQKEENQPIAETLDEAMIVIRQLGLVNRSIPFVGFERGVATFARVFSEVVYSHDGKQALLGIKITLGTENPEEMMDLKFSGDETIAPELLERASSIEAELLSGPLLINYVNRSF